MMQNIYVICFKNRKKALFCFLLFLKYKKKNKEINHNLSIHFLIIIIIVFTNKTFYLVFSKIVKWT